MKDFKNVRNNMIQEAKDILSGYDKEECELLYIAVCVQTGNKPDRNKQ